MSSTRSISRQLTPAFVLHCLGSYERLHRTVAERRTPYITQGKTWEDILPAVVFAINNSVNSSTGYSRFELMYGQRPKFPLGNIADTDFKGVPTDSHAYVRQYAKRLQLIRTEMLDHVQKSRGQMQDRVIHSILQLVIMLI